LALLASASFLTWSFLAAVLAAASFLAYCLALQGQSSVLVSASLSESEESASAFTSFFSLAKAFYTFLGSIFTRFHMRPSSSVLDLSNASLKSFVRSLP
jgi:hypothetical protein